MWPFKKGRNEKESSILKWYPNGESNPFTAPILDIRDFTLNMVSTTKDPSIAEAYVANRSDDGIQFIGQNPKNFSSFQCDLSYFHNGAELEGIVFKSSQMEVKWDIYAYENYFYFVRSWTADLVYKARYENNGDELRICEVLTNSVSSHDKEKIAEQNVHSIMQTHVLGRVWPYYIPAEMKDSNKQQIAVYMFSQFGSKATIATKDNVLNIKLKSDVA